MNPLITSLQHPLVKHLVKLKDQRVYRQACQTALIPGCKLIDELGRSLKFKVLLIQENFSLPSHLRAELVYRVPTALLKKVTGLQHPEPIAAEIPLPPPHPLDPHYPLLILDRLADPGNLGTLLRTALALGWKNVFLTPHTADPFNDKALRAAKGATFRLNLREGSYAELLQLIDEQNRHLIIADSQGTLLSTYTLPPLASLALVLGNESHGICPELKIQGQPVAIPISTEMESFNVAIAGGILMHYFQGSYDPK